MTIKLTRSEVYRRYKDLSVKFKRKQAKSWNSSGCTLSWLNERCAYLDTRYGKPKAKPKPEPKAKKPKPETKAKPKAKKPKPETKAKKPKPEPEYLPDDSTLSAHERWMLAIDRWTCGETVQIRSDAKILMTEMMKLQDEQRAREAEQRAREAEQRKRETEQRAREREQLEREREQRARGREEEARREQWKKDYEEFEKKYQERTRQKSNQSNLVILGLTEADRYNKSAIKKSYRKLALKHHPDKPTGDQEDFKRLVNAYHALI
jgi:hypothetical protein